MKKSDDDSLLRMIERQAECWRRIEALDLQRGKLTPAGDDWHDSMAPDDIAAAAEEMRWLAEIEGLNARLLSTPARSPLGVALKVRLALANVGGSLDYLGPWEVGMIRAALADASRLCDGCDDTPAFSAFNRRDRRAAAA